MPSTKLSSTKTDTSAEKVPMETLFSQGRSSSIVPGVRRRRQWMRRVTYLAKEPVTSFFARSAQFAEVVMVES